MPSLYRHFPIFWSSPRQNTYTPCPLTRERMVESVLRLTQCRNCSTFCSRPFRSLPNTLSSLKTLKQNIKWPLPNVRARLRPGGRTIIGASTLFTLLLGTTLLDQSPHDLYKKTLWYTTAKYTEGGRRILLPPKTEKMSKRKTLVLDLDETLVGNVSHWGEKIHDMITYPFNDRSYAHIHRPYLELFLRYAHKHFELILWTAGTRPYAESCLKNIIKTYQLPSNTFEHIIYRDPSWYEITPYSWYRKALDQLNRNVNETLMLENAPVVVPHTSCVLVADFQYPVVMDNHVKRIQRFPRKSELSTFDPQSLFRTGLHNTSTLDRKESVLVEDIVSSYTSTAANDMTLLGMLSLLKRWKDSTLPTSDFLEEELRRGSLNRNLIFLPRKDKAQFFFILPLLRKIPESDLKGETARPQAKL